MNFTIEKYEEVVHSVWRQSSIFMTSDVRTSKVMIGIDPGSRNLGITTYFENIIILNQIKMNLEKDPVQSMINIMGVVKTCIPYKTNFGVGVIEGASYNEKFGQVNLSESRSAAMICLYQLGFRVIKVSPKQIRKLSLGDGNNKGECFEMPMDAIASFLACLVALQLDELSPQYNPS
jgi:Holliday junction resolvasome RuvABC endonuclease subunit